MRRERRCSTRVDLIELIKMVEDLHKSYRLLAEKYDQLKSASILAMPRPFSPMGRPFNLDECNASETVTKETLEIWNWIWRHISISHPQPVAEDAGFEEAETSNIDLRNFNERRGEEEDN